MVDDAESLVLEALDFGAVVDDVTQTIEAAGLGEFLLGGADGFHHPEAIARIIVNPDFHN